MKIHPLLITMVSFMLATNASLPAAIVIDYNSSGYVTTNQSLARAGTYYTHSYDGGIGQSQVVAFSETTPFSPASGYAGPTFYGGWYRSGDNATGTSGSSILRVANGATYDTILSTYALNASSGATTSEGAFAAVFLKADFSTLSTVPDLILDSLSINISSIVKSTLHWLVKDGSTYYVSQVSTSSSGNWTLSAAADTLWAIFDPFTSLDLSSSVAYSAHVFSDVQAVGFYSQATDLTVNATNASITVNSFSAAVVPEPSTWALLIAGGVLVLAVSSRRRPSAERFLAGR